MLFVIGGWFLGAFLYFKVTLDATFDNDSSILVSILLALMLALTVFLSSAFYAKAYMEQKASFGTAPNSVMHLKMLKNFAIWGIANIVVGKLIVFGFSKKLNRNLGGDVFYDFGRFKVDDSIIFIIIILFPVFVHYLTVLIPVKMDQDLNS